jgi:ion channel-forming bestrophin family protein
MNHWHIRETFAVLDIGKRLGALLFGVTVYCAVAAVIIKTWDIQSVEWGSAASAINTVILGLLLGFRNRAAYDRWWEARGLWGQLTNDSRNLAGKLAAFLPAEVLAKSLAGETLSGFAEALKGHLRDQAPRLRELAGFEQEIDDPPHVPLYLARRMYIMVAEWNRAGLVSNETIWLFDPHLRGLLDVCGGCERIKTTPISPSYKSLLRIGLFLNVLAAPWLIIITPEIGILGVPIIVLACFFLLGVELIDTVVEEPFGKERDDLDLDRYCRTIRDGVRASIPAAETQLSEAGKSW